MKIGFSKSITWEWTPSNTFFGPKSPLRKVGRVLPMVFSSVFRMAQYKDDNHRDDVPHFRSKTHLIDDTFNNGLCWTLDQVWNSFFKGTNLSNGRVDSTSWRRCRAGSKSNSVLLSIRVCNPVGLRHLPFFCIFILYQFFYFICLFFLGNFYFNFWKSLSSNE